MRPRKTHTKSRRGCLNCKRRHVKCDETRPKCKHCERLGDDCIFPRVVPGQYAFPKEPSPSPQPSFSHETPLGLLTDDLVTTLQSLSAQHARPAGSRPQDASTDQGALALSNALPTRTRHEGHAISQTATRASGSLLTKPSPTLDLLDLRLLHHYTSNTCATLDPTAPKSHHRMWQDSIPRRALSSSDHFLLHGLLAVASCHLAVDSNESIHDRSHTWPRLAADHFHTAITDFQHIIEHSKEGRSHMFEDPGTMFAFSSLLVVHNFADATMASVNKSADFSDGSRPRLYEAPGKFQTEARHDRTEDPILILTTSFRLVRGTGTVLRPHASTVLASDLAPLVSAAQVEEDAETIPQFLYLQDWIISLPQLGLSSQVGFEPDELKLYTDAVTNLHAIAVSIRQRPESHSVLGRLFSWPVQVEETFIEHLEQRRGAALVILAHFAMLLSQGTGSWWLADWDQKTLGAIESELREAEGLLKWLLWPKSQMNTI